MASNYQYLDPNGLATLWGIIKNKFGRVDSVLLNGTSATTTDEGGKIVNIPAFGPGTLSYPGLVPSPGTSSTAIFLRGDGTWAQPIGSTYAAATTAVDGLMSASDKIKLNSVASSAEVNQNAFSNIKVGNSTVAADQKTDTVTFVGAGSVGITVDTSTDTVTFTGTNTTYDIATTDTAGLMSAADKQTLDNIVTTGGEPNQDAFSYVIVGGSTVAADDKKDKLTLVGSGSISLSAATGTDTITISGTNTTYAAATTAANGLMSSSDKQKLDGIVAGASTYAAGSGLTLSGTTFNHTNSVTASTVGPTSNVSGASVAIPNIKYDAQGHITGGSTVKYTVGSLAASAITSGTFATARIPNLPASIITEGTFSSAIHASTPGATYSLVNKQYVDSAISSAISGAASFQGTATTASPSTAGTYNAGSYWLVTSDGDYVNGAFECQPGDMIFAINNGSGSGSTSDFTVIQQNLSPITTAEIETICV